MESADPRREYTIRLNRVLNYITEHLDEPVPLQELAGLIRNPGTRWVNLGTP